ncbi:hypothetical protein CHS0354_020734 [Potamilus streckersoni]|uniref:Uncharacterized protein n=1 Tax=Potamilus streckersoni TaxID=2493646 RepID=A0AAE0SU84_9BIVA|nr:hypothetical protein CHS0354_020734 [Potamilus streckersoni]
MTWIKGDSSESAVSNNANELNQVNADDGMQGKTRTKGDINWMLHQSLYSVEANAMKKSSSRFQLQLRNHIRKLHLEQDRPYADLNKIHLSDDIDATAKLVSASHDCV